MAKKILLIEDDFFIRDLYKRKLGSAGFAITDTATGKEGLVALKQDQYDLVLLDIMLPDINGLDVLKEIKKEEKYKNLPVVLLTNLGQENVIKKGFALGAEAYLVKAAYSLDQILSEVKNFLKKKETPPK